jgi:peptidyl-prolyl cis-trans isomerase-like protein 2
MLRTNIGDLNFELHCNYAPKTCENFIELCESSYFDGIKFHRLVPNFMVI